MAELGFIEEQIIRTARQQMFAFISEHAPPKTALALGCVAVAGAFADMLTASIGSTDLVDVINQQLNAAGFELRKLERN